MGLCDHFSDLLFLLLFTFTSCFRWIPSNLFFYSTTNPLSVQLFHFIDFLFAAIYGCRSLSIICIHINLSVHLVSEKKDATINFESSSWNVKQRGLLEIANFQSIFVRYQLFCHTRKYKCTALHQILCDFYRAACNADAVLWWEFCLSVCHTRVLWQNGRKICPDLYTIRKNI